ncbi:MAG: hypothetical protein MI757_23095, partial [Pirellulales bacterium]|nr:hypothetical protein [Pirellulales bacterium]
EGTYGHGSEGKHDAGFIAGKTMQGLGAYDPSCLVLDFRNMSYEWGNSLLGAFQEVDQYMNEEGQQEGLFPVLVVTSDLCRAAFLSLIGKSEQGAAGTRTRDSPSVACQRR